MKKQLNEKVITLNTMGEIIAMKKLKVKYASSQYAEGFRPNKYNPLFEEWKQDAIMGILEEVHERGETIPAEISPEWFNEFKAFGFRAIDRSIYLESKEVNNRLYSIDETISDDEGNTATKGDNIVSVSGIIERAELELSQILKAELHATEYRVFKYYAKGYTDETIQKRMGYKSKASTIRKVQSTLKHAREIAIINGYNLK